MYEELVKALRTCVEKDKGCDDCPYMVRCLKSIREPFIVMTDAADAIEELSKLADAIPHVCECCVGCELEKKSGGCDNAFVLSPKRAMQYLIKPRWIPVTERLPNAEPGDVSERVLVTDGKDVAIVEWFNFEECEPFWGYTGFGKDVTHWMPLPSTEGLNET